MTDVQIKNEPHINKRFNYVGTSVIVLLITFISYSIFNSFQEIYNELNNLDSTTQLLILQDMTYAMMGFMLFGVIIIIAFSIILHFKTKNSESK